MHRSYRSLYPVPFGGDTLVRDRTDSLYIVLVGYSQSPCAVHLELLKGNFIIN